MKASNGSNLAKLRVPNTIHYVIRYQFEVTNSILPCRKMRWIFIPSLDLKWRASQLLPKLIRRNLTVERHVTITITLLLLQMCPPNTTNEHYKTLVTAIYKKSPEVQIAKFPFLWQHKLYKPHQLWYFIFFFGDITNFAQAIIYNHSNLSEPSSSVSNQLWALRL